MDPASIRLIVFVGQKTYKHRKELVIIVLSLFLLSFLLIGSLFITPPSSPGSEKINDSVRAWQPVVQEYANKYGIPDYINVILAIMMVESGGKSLDIMQSSESLGLPPNSITDPVQSIDAGVKLLARTVKDGQKKGLDYWTPVQSYNFGSGFNNFVYKNGKKYSFDLASEFSNEEANGQKVNYNNPVADFNGDWRYAYGNMYYVLLIQQYIGSGTDIGDMNASPLGADKYKSLMNEVFKYNGWPYVWGGSNPKVGFDCSGLTQYSYGVIGYSLPRTAEEQYSSSIPVSDPKPGDLIFFKGTYGAPNFISHVGIYVDENRMYDSDDSGIGYHTWNKGYWKAHLAGFGRVVH